MLEKVKNFWNDNKDYYIEAARRIVVGTIVGYAGANLLLDLTGIRKASYDVSEAAGYVKGVKDTVKAFGESHTLR